MLGDHSPKLLQEIFNTLKICGIFVYKYLLVTFHLYVSAV